MVLFNRSSSRRVKIEEIFTFAVTFGVSWMDLNKLNSCILLLLPDEEESFSVIDLLYPCVNLTAFFNLDKARKNYMFRVSSKFACS